MTTFAHPSSTSGPAGGRSSLDARHAATLRDLARINTDSARFYEAAAVFLDDPNLREFFRQCGSQRHAAAEGLRGELASHGVLEAENGTVLGTLHRWWTELRGAVRGRDEHAVLEEAERNEDAIKKVYDKALTELGADAPGGAEGPLAGAIKVQGTRVRETHDRIRMMRDLTA
jgi:uncharacterized protein (TIGR02284 family)